MNLIEDSVNISELIFKSFLTLLNIVFIKNYKHSVLYQANRQLLYIFLNNSLFYLLTPYSISQMYTYTSTSQIPLGLNHCLLI